MIKRESARNRVVASKAAASKAAAVNQAPEVSQAVASKQDDRVCAVN